MLVAVGVVRGTDADRDGLAGERTAVSLTPADSPDLFAAGREHQIFEVDRLGRIPCDGRASLCLVGRGDRDRVGGLCGRHALDLHDVLKLAFLKARAERGDIAVPTVGLHRPTLNAPADQLIKDLERELPLRDMPDLVRDPSACATLFILTQDAGRNSRQPSGHDARSVTAFTDTSTWQFAVFPNAPQY